MASEPSPGPNRVPLIIAGVIGCLAMCVVIIALGAGAYFIFGAAATPTRLALTMPTLPLVSTSPPFVAPTLPQGLPTPAQSPTITGTLPTLPPVPTIPALRVTATPVPPRAPTGKIAFSKAEGSGDLNEQRYVWIMNADGSGARMLFERASDPAFSPDGTKIAYFHWNDGFFIANADGSGARKYVGDSKARSPAWSRDGRWIAFTSVDVVPSSVLTGETPLRRGVVKGAMPDWSPDDTQIVFQTCRENTCGIYKANAQTGATMLVIGDDGALPVWSPDGRTILYQKEMAGEHQLFVINPDGTGKKQLTMGPAPHVAANWSRDGSFLFYRSTEGGQWAIWRMNADGSNRVKLLDGVPPVDWAFEKLAVSR